MPLDAALAALTSPSACARSAAASTLAVRADDRALTAALIASRATPAHAPLLHAAVRRRRVAALAPLLAELAAVQTDPEAAARLLAHVPLSAAAAALADGWPLGALSPADADVAWRALARSRNAALVAAAVGTIVPAPPASAVALASARAPLEMLEALVLLPGSPLAARGSDGDVD